MAKDIKFNIRRSVDGKQQLVTAATDAENLRKQLDNAQSSATDLRHKLLQFSNLTTIIFSSLSASIQKINSVTKGLVQAYSGQVQNEQRLAEVMRERMGASNTTIESMYKMAEAQKELGIIDDDAQLAGMQQVATFLHQASSIEALLPALAQTVGPEQVEALVAPYCELSTELAATEFIELAHACLRHLKTLFMAVQDNACPQHVHLECSVYMTIISLSTYAKMTTEK